MSFIAFVFIFIHEKLKAHRLHGRFHSACSPQLIIAFLMCDCVFWEHHLMVRYSKALELIAIPGELL